MSDKSKKSSSSKSKEEKKDKKSKKEKSSSSSSEKDKTSLSRKSSSLLKSPQTSPKTLADSRNTEAIGGLSRTQSAIVVAMPTTVNSKWNLIVRANTVEVTTWIDPQWAVSRVRQSVSKKFPPETDNYVLYAKAEARWHRLDPASMISSFQFVRNNTQLWFMPPNFDGGADHTPVVDATGSQVGITTTDTPASTPVASPTTDRRPSLQQLPRPATHAALRNVANNSPPKISTPAASTETAKVQQEYKNKPVPALPAADKKMSEPSVDNGDSISMLEEVMSGMTYSNGETPELMSPTTLAMTERQTSKAATHTRYGVVRTKEEQRRLDQFFEMLVKCCRGILSDVRDVKAMLNENASEDTLFEAAKVAAQKAVEMNTLINRAVSIARSEPDQYEFVRDVARDVRTGVIELISSARTCATNRFDFLTQQAFSNHCRQVVDSIKNLIGAADNLLSDDQEKAKEDEVLSQRTVRSAGDLKLILKDLSSSTYRKDNAGFIHAAKGLIATMNELLDVERSLGCDKYWPMKNATANLVNNAKLTVSGRQSFETFQGARLQLTDAVHAFLQEANRRSIEIRKASRKKLIPHFGPKEVSVDTQSQKDERLKRSAAMKLTNMLTVKFDGFYRQWTQQTPEEAEELYDSMVQEMTKHFLHYVAEKEREDAEKKEKEREAELQRVQAAQRAAEPQRNSSPASPSGSFLGAPSPAIVQEMEDQESEEDREAMKELAKIMKMKNASDWQEMALNLGRLKARMDVGKRTEEMESVEKEIDIAQLPSELDRGSRDLKGVFVEFLLTLSDILLNSEDSRQKLDEKSEAILVKAVDNLFRIMKRIIAVCKAWTKRGKKEAKPKAVKSPRKPAEIWKINIEATENKMTFTKRVKLSSTLGPKVALQKILEKIPVKSNENHGLYLPSERTWIEEGSFLEDYPQLNNAKTQLQLRVKESVGGKQIESIEQMLDHILITIGNASSRGQVQKNVINVLSDATGSSTGNFASVKAQLESNLQEKIFTESNALRILGIQILCSLQLLQKLSKEGREHTGILQIVATCRQVVTTMVPLLGTFETYYHVHVATEADGSGQDNSPDASSSIIAAFQSDSLTFWAPNQSHPKLSGDEKMKGGKLEQLVFHLVVDGDIPLQTFMNTYQSFTNPFSLLQNLIKCYEVPSGFDREKVQFKVNEILKHWISNHFDDIDTKTLQLLKHFIEKSLDPKFIDNLTKDLAKKTEELREKKKSKLAEIVDLKIPEEQLTPADLFMLLNESEIARQFTLIEHKIFSKIKSSELLNQAWNKEKLQHRSPNILYLISRANKLSFWVASIILWFTKVSDRTKVVTKLINIGQHMLQLSNFNTLMGLLAGLNVSAISRLKYTWGGLTPALRETYANLQAVFNPASSFKRYRQEITNAKVKGPVLPYLGSYLKDLTFAEDGNRDFITEDDKTINWTKRELIGKIVMEVQEFQQKPFPYPTVEPINTFLTELPHLEDNDLYDLSFVREPKGADQSNIE